MRLTEFFAYINGEMPNDYISYHQNMTDLKSNKKVKKLKKEIKKQKEKEKKSNKNGTESIDIFE